MECFVDDLLRSLKKKNAARGGCSEPPTTTVDAFRIIIEDVTYPRTNSIERWIRIATSARDQSPPFRSQLQASVCAAWRRMTPRDEAMLLVSLANVTSLELILIQALTLLDREFDKLVPLFGNLRTLSLKSCFLDERRVENKFKALGRLLQKCPNLEKLTLNECLMFEGSTSALCLQIQDNRADFRCQKLKLINIKRLTKNWIHNINESSC
uniref:FBD domain-containing protein n=1 Tax=Oryza punctata TaxID=4537 RepID=A0A0E0KQZ0_ORYPU